jgi:hypothetical protein
MNDEEGESCLKMLDDQNLMLEIPEVKQNYHCDYLIFLNAF